MSKKAHLIAISVVLYNICGTQARSLINDNFADDGQDRMKEEQTENNFSLIKLFNLKDPDVFER